jgi:hypothetical protein
MARGPDISRFTLEDNVSTTTTARLQDVVDVLPRDAFKIVKVCGALMLCSTHGDGLTAKVILNGWGRGFVVEYYPVGEAGYNLGYTPGDVVRIVTALQGRVGIHGNTNTARSSR